MLLSAMVLSISVDVLTPVLEQDTRLMGMTLSPDKNTIVYMLRDDRKPQDGDLIYTIDAVTGENKRIYPLSAPSGEYLNRPYYQDDFSQNYFLFHAQGGKLFAADRRTSTSKEITVDGKSVRSGMFIPGSDKVLIFIEEDSIESVYLHNLQNGKTDLLFRHHFQLGHAMISADGKWAALEAYQEERASDLILINLETLTTTTLISPNPSEHTYGGFESYSFSPDSRKLVSFYESGDYEDERGWLYVYDLDSLDVIVIDEGLKSSWLTEMALMVEGEQGFFLAHDRIVYQRDVNGDGAKDFVFSDYSGKRLNVVSLEANEEWDDYWSLLAGVWNSDKSQIIFQRENTNSFLALDVNNASVRELPFHQEGSSSWDVKIYPGCTPGTFFFDEYKGVHDSQTGISTGVYKLKMADTSTGKETQVYEGDKWLGDVSFSKDCKSIYALERRKRLEGLRIIRIGL